ncbi:MAG: hypothetical protein EXS08_14310 [Planctomycetes bacterium]|nr:hypothetical protein [Planctomycetota bacterium]
MLFGVWLLLLQQTSPVVAPVPVMVLADEAVLVRSWLTLKEVDVRGRRPFRPDAVLARHLLAPGASPPQAGESAHGDKGEANWQAFEAGEDGRVADVAWAYARITSEHACIVLAQLDGASTLHVNGAPFAGDPYGFGFGGVPVALVAGVNELFVSGVRGAFRLRLAPCEEGVQFGPWDFTLPSLVVGEPSECLSGVLLFNASSEPAEASLEVRAAHESAALFTTRCRLAPLGVRKVRLAPRFDRRFAEPGELDLTLRLEQAGRETAREQHLLLPIRPPQALRVCTFTSDIDGSVQKYAALPPIPGRDDHAPLRLLLSLHGAGVDCEGQAGSYAPKPDFWIIAPTNRRPFGFDWQDWGRLDAYEALRDAQDSFGLRQASVHLAGHSMGGHGTWHLAANDPDRWASIAPSAGWRSFDTYGGRPEGALRALWQAADGSSRTEDLLTNLAALPTYVLHGEADDNVPAAEGHAMVEALKAAGGEPLSHFEPGAGHWWDDASGAPGTACLDWPGFFELFRGTTVPSAPLTLDWTGVDPSVDDRHHWLGVDQPLEYGAPFRVQASFDPLSARATITTHNVRRLGLGFPSAGIVREVELDGQRVSWDEHQSSAVFVFADGSWSPGSLGLQHGEKSGPHSGPLKRAFANWFVLVVPTAGSAAENSATLERARYDAEVWWYRGNGDAEIITDEEYLAHGPEVWRLPEGSPPSNVILYGNADTNRAWKLVPEDFPLRVKRGSVRLGAQEWKGDALGALAVGPVGDVLFAVLGSSGPEADRAAVTLAPFISGVGYPDYVVYGPEVLTQGDGGVRAAGFFDHAWRLPPKAEPRAR